MTIQTIDVSKLRLSEINIRKSYDPNEIAELAQSITSVGLLTPLVVEHDEANDQYEIVAGHRRFLALQSIGFTGSVICSVVSYESEAEVITTMLVENCQRVDITPLEEAFAYESLRKSGIKQTDIAKRVGKSQAHVSKRLSLTKLPEWARDAIAKKTLSLDLAHRMTALEPIHLAVLKSKADKLTAYDLDNAERNQSRAKESAALEAFVNGRTDVVEEIPDEATFVRSYTANNLGEMMITDTMVLRRMGNYIQVYDTAPQSDDDWDDDGDDASPANNWWNQYQSANENYLQEREAWLAARLKQPTMLAQLAAVAMREQLMDCWYDEVITASELSPNGEEITDDQLLSFLRTGNNTLRLWTNYHLAGKEFDAIIAEDGIIRPTRESFMNNDPIDPIEEDMHDDLGYEMDEAV